jgi:starch-binding outer membrane protein SusE/F
MNKIIYLMVALIGFSLFSACEKETKDPVLDMSKSTAASLTEPNDESQIVLLEDFPDSLITFSWNPASYNLENLENTIYSLQIAMADSGFANARELVSTTETSFSVNFKTFNSTLINLGLVPETPMGVEVRILSRINTSSAYSILTSAVTKMTVTPYDAAGPTAPPLYLIGDGTSIGWDNNNTSLQFAFDNDLKVYKIVATLSGGGKWIKAFEVPGQWAPQWGTDATGTSTGGPLVYRPDEAIPDPPAIPTPAEVGDYLIIFDLVNQVYTVELADIAQTMHIIGDATTAGWNNAQAVPMTKLAPGKFELVTTLSASATEGFKFLVNQGAWAPMYGTVEGAAFENGILIYRPTEADPDPKSIPPPATTGSYKIEMDIVQMTYKVTAQ